MHTSAALVAALLATDGLAAVVTRPRSYATAPFDERKVHARYNPSYKANGPRAMAKAHLKFKKPVPEDVARAVKRQEALRKRATGSATNAPETDDSEYLTEVSIGSPAQKLNLDFDTGSSDLWVFSTLTESSEVDGQTKYNPNSSSTATLLSGETWSITYGDGSSSSGIVYTDVVNVGGLTVSAQAVEPAEKVSSSFTSDSSSSGLLGLASSKINTVSPTQQKTFYDSASSNLTSNLFTADLKHQADGTYNFGFIDTTAYTGSIGYTTADQSEGYWGFTAANYAVGTKSYSTSITGIADTGTTLLMLPDDVVTEYYSQVSGAEYDTEEGGYVFSCSADLPDFSFAVGNTTINVPGSYMNYAAIDTTDTTCYGGIQSDSSIGFAIFGDVALKAAFVVFDGGNEQLGWANKETNATSTTTAASNNNAATTSSSNGSNGKGRKGGKGGARGGN